MLKNYAFLEVYYNVELVDNLALYEGNLLDLDKESIEKLKKLRNEIKEFKKKHNIQEVNKREEDIKKVKLNKFYYKLYSLDGKKNYIIRGKITNVNIKRYKKVKKEYGDILNLCQKYNDSFYENGTNLSDDDNEKLNKFIESNGEFLILSKITYLEKKDRDSNALGIVEYEEILDIYKKA